MESEVSERKKLIFVSNNPNKLEEIRILLPPSFQLLGLQDIGWSGDIDEPYETFEENARQKASTVYYHTGLPCFADDSGLEVDYLDNKPGVYSARYGGLQKNSMDNMLKVLAELGNHPQRAARFVSVIAFQWSANQLYYFRGVVEGNIHHKPEGNSGFGYDPIFIPLGFQQTFGQLPPGLKNRISHRAMAMFHFVHFLRTADI